jgi:hypothetical protein
MLVDAAASVFRASWINREPSASDAASDAKLAI